MQRTATPSTRPRRVLNKVTQPEVCFACHKTQRAQIHQISTHPILAGKMACSDCHNPHGSTGPEAAGQEHRERDLLHLPRRKARSLPVGAQPGRRRLHQLPHAARLDQRRRCSRRACRGCARSATAATTARAINSGANLPTGNATTVNGLQPLGKPEPARADQRARLPELPRAHPRLEPSGRRQVPAVIALELGEQP